MIFSYNWLQTYFEKELPKPEKLAELLTMHIFEVEGIEKISGDYAIDVKILPDRAGYAYAHENVAREINAFTDCNFKGKYVSEYIKTGNVDIDADQISESENAKIPKLIVEDEEKVPVFTARYISHISNASSPAWLSDALTAVGQRSISFIVDLTNYVMLDCGQPMHAFDANKIKGDIHIRYAKEGEKVILLDGREVALDSTVLVIADEEGALDIAGVKGGKKAEVDSDTKNIIITAGNFNSSYIRKTSQKVGIKNDATKRYENTVTLERVFPAQIAFVELLKKEQADIRASKLFSYGMAPEAIFKKHAPIKTTAQFISEKIGMPVSAEEIMKLIQLLEIEVVEKDGEIEIIPPLYRGDLVIAEDIVEEVARLKGMNSMPEVVPKADSEVPSLKSLYYSNEIRNMLLGLGMSEVYTHTLVEEGDWVLANPLSAERRSLRSRITGEIEKALVNNVQHIDLLGGSEETINEIKIFEIGKVFKDKKETFSLVVGIASKVSKGIEKKIEDQLSDIGQKLNEIGAAIGSGISADNWVKNTTPAVGGVVPVFYCVAEINFDLALKELPTPTGSSRGENMPAYVDMQSAKRFAHFSPYPYMVRDIAVFIPGPTGKADLLRNVILSVNNPLIAHVRKFDEFEKKNKETGEIEKTSYAFRMIFQSFERTLTDTEVQTVMDEILRKISENDGWEVR